MGSALYHALVTKWSGVLDVTAIYAVFAGLVGYAAAALARSTWAGIDQSVGAGLIEQVEAILILLFGAVTAYLLRRQLKKKVIWLAVGLFFTAVLLAGLATAAAGASISVLSAVVLFLLFLLAGAAWLLDIKEAVSLKRLGHGTWHIVTAAGITFLFILIDGIHPAR